MRGAVDTQSQGALIIGNFHPIDWAHIDVTLVDDRWVPETDGASNARLVRETLLQNAASGAYFLSLVDTARPLDAHIADLNGDGRPPTPDDMARARRLVALAAGGAFAMTECIVAIRNG